MPKIDLYTVRDQDNFVFDNFLDNINLIEVADLNQLWNQDHHYVVLNRNKILSPHNTVINGIDNNIREFLSANSKNKVIINDYHEVSKGHYDFLKKYDLLKFADNRQLLIIATDMPNDGFCGIDMHLPIIVSPQNIAISLQNFEKIYEKTNKPYTFSCYNGRASSHRVVLIEMLSQSGALDNALWSLNSTNFDTAYIREMYGISPSLDHVRLHSVPDEYEHYKNIVQNNIWGTDIHDIKKVWGADDHLVKPMVPNLYIDTYFTVITETNYEIGVQPLTEKIWRPILMGHPFISVTTPYYYKTLKKNGFKTFGSLIDESFDEIENPADRLKRTAETIISLSRMSLDGLNSFLKEARAICEHNREECLSRYGRQLLTNHTNMRNFLIKNFNYA